MAGEIVSDEQRDAALARLRELIRTGHLEFDRYTQLADRIAQARTDADLHDVLTALPPAVRMTAPERRLREPLVLATVTAKLTMDGRWQVGRQMKVTTTTGRVVLDFSDAEFDDREVDLDLRTSTGTITLVVPAAVDVQLAGISGAFENRLGHRPALPGGVLLRIHANAVTGKVVLQPPGHDDHRRSWWRRKR